MRQAKRFLSEYYHYVFIIILCAIGSGISLWALTSAIPSDFEARNIIVQECLASEQYTREECIVLASGE